MIKRWLVGRPLTTAEEAGQRLPKRLGLAVFASDDVVTVVVPEFVVESWWTGLLHNQSAVPRPRGISGPL